VITNHFTFYENRINGALDRVMLSNLADCVRGAKELTEDERAELMARIGERYVRKP